MGQAPFNNAQKINLSTTHKTFPIVKEHLSSGCSIACVQGDQSANYDGTSLVYAPTTNRFCH